MTAPCPALGFRVTMEPADVAGDGPFWDAWTALLERRGLSCAGRLAPDRALTVTSEAAQATESDRSAVKAWLSSRTELQRWHVGELEDLR